MGDSSANSLQHLSRESPGIPVRTSDGDEWRSDNADFFFQGGVFAIVPYNKCGTDPLDVRRNCEVIPVFLPQRTLALILAFSEDTCIGSLNDAFNGDVSGQSVAAADFVPS